MNFLLAGTVGLLAFLLIDKTLEAQEIAATSAALFEGALMVWLAALSSILLLIAIGRWRASRVGARVLHRAWHRHP